jgi:hypothetical protein
LRAASVIWVFFTSSVGHYKKVTFYFVKKRWEGNKRNKSIITPELEPDETDGIFKFIKS